MFYSLILGCVIISISIIFSVIILGRYISSLQSDIGNYQAIQIDKETIIIIDTTCGKCRKKKISDIT